MVYKQEKNIHILSKEILNGVSKVFTERLENKGWQDQKKTKPKVIFRPSQLDSEFTEQDKRLFKRKFFKQLVLQRSSDLGLVDGRGSDLSPFKQADDLEKDVQETF